jgi:hypothetical protein
MRRSALGLAVAAFSLTAGAKAATQRTSGRVEYATARRLYLDAGAREGLAPGATLQLKRGERPISTCRVDVVSARYATCIGVGQPGDTFALLPPLPVPTPRSEKLPAPLSDVETTRRHRVLEAAAQEKVEYRGAPPGPSIVSGRTEVRLAYATWASQRVGPWQQERLDVAVRGAPVGGGFALYADLSARRWSLRSGPVSARPDAPTQLYVWEAELARRPAQGGLALALGRVRPWSAPGSTVIDGGQAGGRTRGNVELGVFGGGVPDPGTLAPSFQRNTAGAYLAVQVAGDATSVVRFLRQEVRLAYSNGPELGRRAEAEALGQISLGRVLDLGAEVRVAYGDQTSTRVESTTVDVGLRPFERLSVLGSFRYTGLSVPERDGPGVILSGGAARHADVTASWEAAPWLTLSGVSGLAKDLTTGISRQFAGPQLGLPRLFGAAGGASIGFAAEGVATSGHTTWVQLLTNRPRWLQVLLRGSWFQTRSLGPYTEDELGAYASITAQLGPAVALRLAALGRAGGAPGIRPLGRGSLLGGTVDAALAGRF